MSSLQDLNTMNAAVAQLQSEQLAAQAVASGSWSTSLGTALLGDQSSQDAQVTALSQTEAMIGNLSGPYYLEVQTDQRTLDNWLGIAAQTHRTIASIDLDAGNWTFGGVVSATASATSTQVVADAKTAAVFGTPLLLAAVALVLLIEFGPLLMGREG